MNPETNEQTTPEALLHGTRSHQPLIIVGLLALLAAIIGGYIYLGMWWATQSAVPVVVEEVPVAEVPPVSDTGRREQILNALEQATGTVDSENRDAIINALNQAPATVSEERKAQIIDALNNSNQAPLQTEDAVEAQP